HAVLGRGGDAALSAVLVVAAAPCEDAAVLRQGEAVGVAGEDCIHAPRRGGGDAALPALRESPHQARTRASLVRARVWPKPAGIASRGRGGGGRDSAVPVAEAGAAPGEHAAVLRQGEAVIGGSRDCRRLPLGRSGDVTLATRGISAASGEHAAVLGQGKVVAE